MCPQPNDAACVPLRPAPAEYSLEERRYLLSLAHDSIVAAAQAQPLRLAPPDSPHLAEPRGAFTTLHLAGQLRGCVGYVFAVRPLWQTVAETALAAAFQDTRFYPVTADEAPQLEIDISVLSPIAPIAPEAVEVGKHGLVVAFGSHRGLLLPQVPTEYGWDRDRFLEETCQKAGLPPDMWKRGATVEAFTAEVFGDRDV